MVGPAQVYSIVRRYGLCPFWIVLSILAVVPHFAIAQDFLWAERGAATNAVGIVSDASGNTYITGTFTGTVDMDPGSGEDFHTSNGAEDIYIQRINADRSYGWTRTVGGIEGDFVYSPKPITLNSQGEVLISGVFNDTVDFDWGPGTDSLTTTWGQGEAFILKMSIAGDYLWTKKFDGWGSYIEGLTVDSVDNIYVSGEYWGTIDCDPGVGTANKGSNGFYDFYICKLDSDGNYLWGASFGANSMYDSGAELAITPTDEVYVTGRFGGTVDFDTGAGTYNRTSSGTSDIYVSKWSSAGVWQWTRTFGGATGEYPMAITSDSSGAAILTGLFLGTVDFDPGAGVYNLTDATGTRFILKLTAAGNFSWAKASGGLSYAIGTDSYDRVYNAGNYSGNVDFDPGAGDDTLTANGTSDAFLSVFSSSGSYLGSKVFTGEGLSETKAVYISDDDNLYLVGDFSGLADFDPEAGKFYLKGAGYGSAYLVKFDLPPAPGLNVPLISQPLQRQSFSSLSNSVSGTATPLQTVEIFVDGLSQGTTPVDGAGNWTLPVTFSEGTHEITANAIDGGFVVYGPSAAITIYIDTLPPPSPVVLTPLNGEATRRDHVQFGGTSLPNGTVEVYRSGLLFATINVDGLGEFTAELLLPEGLSVFSLVAYDEAGNQSVASDNISVYVDYPLDYGETIKLGGVNAEYPSSFTVDSSGNKLVLGLFSLTTDLDPGPGVDSYTSAGGDDIFIVKLDVAGNYLWGRRIGGTVLDTGTSIVTDSSNNVYIAGYFTGTLDFDPGVGVVNRTSAGNNDCFLLRLNSDGNYSWVVTFGGTGDDRLNVVSIDLADNLYLAGTFNNTIDMDPGAGVDNRTSQGSFDIFLSKFNSAGVYQWSRAVGGNSYDTASVIEADCQGALAIAGMYNSTVDFDPGSGVDSHTAVAGSSPYISKYAYDGTYLSTIAFDGGGGDTIYGFACDPAGGMYLAGGVRNTVDLDPGPGVASYTSKGQADAFILKLNSDGGYAWSYAYGDFNNNNDLVFGLAVDDAGRVTAGGMFYGQVGFSPIAGEDVYTSKSSDGFIIQYDSDGNYLGVRIISGSNSQADSVSEIVVRGADVFAVGTFVSDNVDFDFSYGVDQISTTGSYDTFVIRLVQDVVAPVLPVIDTAIDGVNISSGNLTIDGQAGAGDRVELFVDGVSALVVVANAYGAWQAALVVAGEGQHVITARAIDTSDNRSAVTDNYTLTLDLTAPVAPIISGPANGYSSLNTTVLLQGSAESGSTVTLFENGVSVYSGQATGGSWSATRTLTPSNYNYYARATDLAGNVSTDSAIVGVTIIPDLCPSDTLKSVPGVCGCGVAEDISDNDLDGTVNCLDSSPDGSTLRGQIALTNMQASPLAGVTVSAGGRSTTTNIDGSFVLRNVVSGDQTIRVSLDGYRFSPAEKQQSVTGDISGINFVATPNLTNPAYAFWNGYLEMVNVLEMMNTGEEPLVLNLTVYGLSGEGQSINRSWTIPPLTQRDIIINDLPGFAPDTYGMLKLTSSHNNFDGRVSLYYPDTSGEVDSMFGFAYSDALRNSSQGQTAVMFNSYHPGNNTFDGDNTVYNWLTIGNLGSTTEGFTVRRYNLEGVLVFEQHVVVPALGRRDVDGGHINPGPNNVGTNIIIPDNITAPYMAKLVRYAEGSNFNSFDYAISLPSVTAQSRTIHAPITGATENYIEAANILGEDVSVQLAFYDAEGALLASDTVNLPAYSQRHFPTLGLFSGEAKTGYVSLTPDTPGALIAQSVFYHRELSNRSIQTAYASPARESFGNELFTTYNSFLAMKNSLRIINLSLEESSLSYSLPLEGADEAETSVDLPANGASELSVSIGRVRSDSYGLVRLRTTENGVLMAEMLRLRQLTSGKREFGIVTQAR
ncbi:MAG: hypothetical protein PHC51_05710 [bacterium]|nr:hypothetical protein [bacterium]